MILGVQWLAGRSPKYFAVLTPSPIAYPTFAECLAFVNFDPVKPEARIVSFLTLGFLEVLFFVSEKYKHWTQLF